jgi:hypothetical protein
MGSLPHFLWEKLMPGDRSQIRRDQLRQEGDERNEQWRSLSFKQQLRALKKRPGESVKQRARIQKQKEKIDEEQKHGSDT